MWFHVNKLPPSEGLPPKYPYTILVEDKWDDFGYRTTFQATLHLSETEEVHLGDIKIFRMDQKGGNTEMPHGPFRRLGKPYASVGTDLKYYESLYQFGRGIYISYLKGLRDVAFDADIKEEAENFEGYKVSLLRFSGSERTISDASRLFHSQAIKRKSTRFKVKFRTKASDESVPFTIDFEFSRQALLPGRINALIGYNGSGKTTLLSNLAVAASGYGYNSKEAIVESTAGRFIGPPPPFKTVVVVSYSPFDTFVIPGKNEVEQQRLEKSRGIFGYVYCGLRERSTSEVDGPVQNYRLKTQEETADEFIEALKRLREAGRREDLIEILKPLLRDPSFKQIGLSKIYGEAFVVAETRKVFQSLSSGHKVVLKIVVELTSHILKDNPTLVLIDEPETHLHPPLLAAFLKSVRVCLERFDGYAVVATHSPVVLQETPAKHVHVIKRLGNSNKVVAPVIETFAEGIGIITQDVFNLGDGTTDWHETLDTLSKNRGLKKVEALFGRKLGFAARSYIQSVREELDSSAEE